MHISLLLEILSALLNETKAQFVILGSGSKTEENAFLKIAKEFPNRLAALIGFDDALARRIFAGTDFFIMPSRWEGPGHTIIEALAAGLPSIVSNCPFGPEEAVGFGQFGHFP